VFPVRYGLSTVYLCVRTVLTTNSDASPVRYGLPTVYLCSVRFSLKTATVSPPGINGLGSVAET
jgi:hypothetical protein